VTPEQTYGIPLVTVTAAALRELMEAGNELAESAEQHWDTVPMERALARWEAALAEAGRQA
jgi:hypothetical protein